MAAVMRICELKVTLRDIDPPIWRRIRVRSSVTLAELHDTLQRAMGWSDSHLHQFVANGRRFGRVDPEFPKVENENKVSIGELLSEPGDRLEYEYDFGDCWRHEVVLEQVLGSERDAFYPRLTDGARACPPEDCGGAAGYEHLLTALAHPMHPEHRELTEWVGGAFDAEAFDLVERNRALQSASRQTRR
ncbi:MAG: plasmid pRiA4b ORF-3 family protein [Candidatus Eisenbacteria bacterium]|uniref:Plasmid pRiA4b ORF-3 family protein n=1 Tax=Eiseniibacteriota bacterium TaxID=2212470 RepID=A0A849SBK4_UNCEI|nr:plasmid pRiA4b ORF-3 family protein [Candidatus Eisenbacteria bacterium]